MKMHLFLWTGDNFDEVIFGKSGEIGSFWTTSECRQNMNMLWPASWRPQHPVILGKKANEINDQEKQSEGKENISIATAALWQESHLWRGTNGELDAQAAVEGALLGLYDYDELKQKQKTLILREVGTNRPDRKESRLLLGRTWPLAWWRRQPTRWCLPYFHKTVEKNLWSANSKSQFQITPKSWGEEWKIGSF